MNLILVRSLATFLATGATLSVVAVGSLVSAVSTGAFAQEAEHRLGEHPAVIVKRRSANEAYDYASKFYPHPAGLFLSAEPPRQLHEHPAVVVYRRWHEQPCTAIAAPMAAGERRHGD
ncbi:MAG TPA: hypothetical protein VFU71_03120 [Burkholderiaceae bacterium]|nr:hypothetical protein [Burkholderiaceae bacterium]